MSLIKTQFTEAEKHRRMKPLTANICELGNSLIAESGLAINPDNSYVVVRA